MQTIQIRLTKELIRKSQELVNQGIYSNKSEVVRDALRRLIFNNQLKLINKRNFIIMFSSDFHGNIIQYKKFFAKAYNDKVNAVIIGGDIAPKDPKHRTIKDQRLFLEKQFVPLIKKFGEKNKKRNHSCLTYLMMGNDDFKSNQAILKKYEKQVGFRVIHNRCMKLHEDFKIIGYSYVPLTPFINKDWEKLDLVNEDEHKKRKGFVVKGRKSKENYFIKVRFDLKNRTNTIEKDLRKLLAASRPEKTIMVIHTPPYNTSLDFNGKKEHVGSAAVRKIIEEKQPYVTLHGHIHETVNISGKFMELINKTICMSSGNDYSGESLAVVKFNLYNPISAIREVI